MRQQYDFIICGAGCAGLSLAVRLSEPRFKNKKILILDRTEKNQNDRTWSFWTTKENNRYESIYKKTWKKIAFYAPNVERIENADPYSYHTIRGIDFYNYSLSIIHSTANITFSVEIVKEIIDVGDKVEVRTNKENYIAEYVFDSVVRSFPTEKKLFVWQHFLGWEVELIKGSFDIDTATFMDFRIDQGNETRFVYVLPFSEKTALIEATLFSQDILAESDYEDILKKYISKYIGKEYIIKNKELGKIPMTSESFGQGSQRVIPIGTNNATVKPSSGYAFTRIQRESDLLIEAIEKNEIQRVRASRKFLAYDKTLLNVLLTKKESGRHIFGLMFKHNRVKDILNFLDETSSLYDEMKIFSTLPTWSFLRAFIKENVLSITKS